MHDNWQVLNDQSSKQTHTTEDLHGTDSSSLFAFGVDRKRYSVYYYTTGSCIDYSNINDDGGTNPTQRWLSLLTFAILRPLTRQRIRAAEAWNLCDPNEAKHDAAECYCLVTFSWIILGAINNPQLIRAARPRSIERQNNNRSSCWLQISDRVAKMCLYEVHDMPIILYIYRGIVNYHCYLILW